MDTSIRVIPALIIGIVLACTPVIVGAETPRDSTWVMTFDHDFYNWATPHEDTFTFPPLTEQFAQVLLHYTIE
ncbi:MAG: hypothetical protein KAJ78_00870, partial [Acidobacteria bacterium]|nr:hypothetical protein [Acidobacteriota bacterium]